MAFSIRAGIMRNQAGVKWISSRLGLMAICRGARAISSARLYVGGLSYETDDHTLRESFSKHGEVSDSQVIVDRDTGKSRGFGFVTYTSTEAASSAIQAFDGQLLNGRTVRVNFANERIRVGPGGGGYGGYGATGGGYGGSGGGGYGGTGGGGYGGSGGGGYGGSGGGGYGSSGGVSYGGGGGGRGYGNSGGRYGSRDSYDDDGGGGGGRRRSGGRYGSRDSYGDDDGDRKRRGKGGKFGGKGDFDSDDYDEDDEDEDDDDDDESEAYNRKR